MLTGMTRSNSKSKDSRLPITYNILKEITSVLPAICSSDYEIRLFTAAFVLAFFAFLRVGEKTCSQTNMKFGHAILFKNVIANEDSISIVLETSKTDQFRNGVNIIVQKQTDNAVCPVNHLKKYLACRPPFGGPLFCHYGGKPLTRYQFSAVLKKGLRCR